MSKMFLYIYDCFERHRLAFYAVLFLSIGVFALMASRITLQENITTFFGDSNDNKNAAFENVAVKDKIIVMLNGDDPDAIVASADIFVAELDSLKAAGYINSITAYADEESVGGCISFVYEYLPIFLDDEDFAMLEEKISSGAVDASVENAYRLATSPSGMIVGDVIMQDPLNIGTPLLGNFEKFNPGLQYEIYDGRIFTEDLRTMLVFVQPSSGMGDTGNNEELVRGLERAENMAELDGVSIDCIGAPVIAVHNARQIKQDTTYTLSIALLFILLVIFLSFRNRWAIPLIVMPPLYGALFAFAMVWLVQGGISAIAIGAGTVVLGISLSYSIHIVSHHNSIPQPKEIIEELAKPLTIGCFTTIGAFAALVFTSSPLLQDMGLFAVFTLVGTTVFSLVFLPHFLGKKVKGGKKSPLLGWIEKIVGYRYEGSKWLIMPIAVIFVAALFCYQDVEFDDDMSNINYMPQSIKDAEQRSMDILGDENNDVYIVTGNVHMDSLAGEYDALIGVLDDCLREGEVESVVSLSDFVVSPLEQQRRIDRWNRFWDANRDSVLSRVKTAALSCGFKEGAFNSFEELVSRDFTLCTYSDDEIGGVPVISEWINCADGYTLLMCRVAIGEEHKPSVYEGIEKLPNTTIIDRGYFASKMVEATSDDFSYILLVSSLIVFVALLISYGRIELTLLTFLPMAVSWVIILGLMALFGIKFNIVNIILATFIFGIGDDFSIFIMDGLMQEYRSGKKLLGAHKTAIFFSAFTAIFGMGVLVFAQHPALKSIALISVLGLSVVVLVSYTIQPMLFRMLVTSQTEKGNFPYTLGRILITLYSFLFFLAGCIFLHIYMLLLIVLPIGRRVKKLAFHRMVYRFTRLFIRAVPTVRVVRDNSAKEDFRKPAVIIANHQSFIDILLLLSTTPKIIMVTNSWVWNSPFFGWIVKYAEFYHAADGYEALADRLRGRVAEGYSIVVFPEGTRSADCSIQRFHKGAFYLAQLLKLDVLPVMIYGAGMVSAKKQGFYIKPGIIVTKILARVVYGDSSFGVTYQEQTKNMRHWYEEQYRALNDEFGRVGNTYFKDAIVKNYIYMSPILEWYMRIKCRKEGFYDIYDRLIPRKAAVVDVGCGYGQMDFMLGLLSPERTVIGVDYDEEKIAVAENTFLHKKTNTSFVCADMRSLQFPSADAVVFNDSLHYVDAETQELVLSRVAACLNDGGMIIVKDADVSRTALHYKTQRAEKWSTGIMNFNKTSAELCFVSAEWMRNFAVSHKLEIEIILCGDSSSETLYILKKKE